MAQKKTDPSMAFIGYQLVGGLLFNIIVLDLEIWIIYQRKCINYYIQTVKN